MTVQSQTRPSEQQAPAAGPSRRRRRRIGDGTRSFAATVGLLVLLGLLLQAGGALGWWPGSTLPKPSDVVPIALNLLGDPTFWGDFGRSAVEILGSVAFGVTAGLLIGVLFWKMPGVGRVFEPYLVAFYSVPLVLFYPMLIVMVGINVWSVIIIGTVMAGIPMAVNTWVGLSGIRPVYLKLAKSVGCNQVQTLVRVALPAAAPMVFAGLRLGTSYALIGVIAMEFTTAQAGLGYRIRYLYESFETPHMYAYVTMVLVIAVILTAVLEIGERVVAKRSGR
ncbi:ABC transporter permease [Amycolatopsis taiwanensis]|uniref:ABC transporter permease n=1 Tax=Amycolatopsis taiwanensis TaxID=342230 RepID=A0A9W6R3X9_9PSEU|nr:ABC transporter permease [Amycolatopsis taiwanensis]GLY68113.1 ABC transporter permease [Amycolatopsis taiwanensis]